MPPKVEKFHEFFDKESILQMEINRASISIKPFLEKSIERSPADIMPDNTGAQHFANQISVELPMDWHLEQNGEPEKVETASDALIRSLLSLGKVDINYMSRLCGQPCGDIVAKLGSAIWQNPDTWGGDIYEGWETTDQYLSGPLMQKLEKARQAAAEYPALFERNVRALEAIMPHAIAGEDIRIVLGSPWIPADVIEQFLNHLFAPYIEQKRVFHDETGAQWRIERPRNARYHFRKTRALSYTYGSGRYNGLVMLEKTLNHAEVKDPALKEKQKKLEKAFQKWLKQNPSILEDLRGIYNSKFGYIRKRTYDGSFLDFPGMSEKISLFPHQRNVIARILLSGSTLLAHKVGAGKTFTMIAAAMELKRLGRSEKNLFVVPNNVTGQWRDAFEELYPGSKVLLVQSGEFTPKKRIDILRKIRDEDYDGIVLAYSCAERIPLSAAFRKECLLAKKIAILNEAQNLDREYDGDVSRRLAKLDDEIETMKGNGQIPENLCFDNLGITSFFLDESHNYKNIPLDTGLAYVRGINAKGSKKCADMLARCDSVRSKGGIAVLATGTPVCNSITDIYTIQRFLQKETLKLLDIGSFDVWAANFGEIRDVFELDVDGTRFRNVERFVRFHNLPELSSIFNMVADYADEIAWDGVAECRQREDIQIPNSSPLAAYVRTLSERADWVRGARIDPKEDNMLKITTDGRKAALDLRLVGEKSPPPGKAEKCAEIVAEIWRAGAAEHSAQVIFCDLSVPKRGFNVYGELKRLLVEQGIPGEEIAFAHDCEAPGAKERLYAKVRNGKVRIIIGSTFKLGLGVNIQDRLAALHHLDAPWRPADMVQREGRILRKGNMYEFVRIFRYVTEGSFDAYCWQILETKQRFIANFLSGNVGLRQGAELDSHVLSYAEVKALALGEPLIRKRVECATKIEKHVFLQREWEEEREKMRLEIVSILEKISRLEKRIHLMKMDKTTAKANPANLSIIQKQDLEELLRQNVAAGTGEAVEKSICKYRGFEIVLRSSQASATQGVWLKGQDSIFVETGLNEIDWVAKLDEALKNLTTTIRKAGEELKSLRIRKQDLEEELLEPDPWAPKLEKLNRALKKLDQKLAAG